MLSTFKRSVLGMRRAHGKVGDPSVGPEFPEQAPLVGPLLNSL